MNTPKTNPSCDAVQLDVLLFGDEESDEYRIHADHVESCPQCQQRLVEVVTDDDWAEMRTVLQARGAEGSPSASRPEPIRLDFLSPPSHPELLGQLGRYEIEELIGAGGMGIVFKAFDTELNRRVAVKVLAPHLAHSGAARQRFAREARAAAAVVHEHVVAIHNVEPEHKVPFLVMQYVPGESLQDRVDREGPLGAAEILRIGMQAASGLAAAHAQGVIHRDVKPANILLEHGVERTVLTDFGLARAVDDATVTRSGVVAGTPHYMSPEQASGQAADHRSDLFSLGAVLYFMATGHAPFRAEQAMAVLHRICNDRHRPAWEANPEIPDRLSEIIDRLLAKKPHRRFASAEHVEAALAETLATLQQPNPARRRSIYRRLMRSHRPWVLGTLAAAGIAAVALGVAGFFHTRGPDTSEFAASSSGNAVLPAALAELLASSARPQTDYSTELTRLESDLQRLEAGHRPGASLFLQHADAAWHNSLATLEHDLSRAENFVLVDPRSIIDPKPEGGKR